MTLAGFVAKNHPQQVAVGGADGHVDDRWTPDEFFKPLNTKHRFTLDAAASVLNHKCKRYFTVEDDGLRQSWGGERVWCNPPYSGIGPWIAKSWSALRSEGAELVVMLIPANRTEQRWWQELVEPFRDRGPINGVSLRVEFLPGRMRFHRPGWLPGPKGNRPPFGCCLLTFTKEPRGS